METYQRALTALGDPTRRALFERLKAGPIPVGRLAGQFPVSRSAVSQHLRVLSEAGLVQHRRLGTRRLYAVDPEGLMALRTYLDRGWEEALARFQSIADADPKGGKNVVESKVDLTIRKSVQVALPVERAFALVTEGISSWWPYQTASIAEQRVESVVMEGRAGGRLYEQLAGDGQALWGHVWVWDPPKRLLLMWRVNPDNPTTLIEVMFTPTVDGALVQLEHRGWEKYGDSAAAKSAQYSSGWDDIFMTRYQAAAER